MPDITLDNGLVQLELDSGSYADAKEQGLSMEEYLQEREEKAGFDLAHPNSKELTAFERQLMANNIAIGSANFGVDDFIKASPMSKYLFPEFVSQSIYMGMNMGKLEVKLDDTYSVKTRISNAAARTHAFDVEGSDLTAKRKVKEGSAFPRATIKTKDKAVETRKVGIEVNFTYDALKRMTILKAQNVFQLIGWNLSKQITQRALQVIKDGDGNTGTASPISETATTTWKYSDIVNLLLQPNQGMEFTHAVVNKAFLEKILTDATNFNQFQSVNILEGFVKSGEPMNFFGINWKTHPDMDNDCILAYNKNLTLELLEDAAGQLVESDRFIREQIEGSVVSYEFEFAKLYQASSHWKSKKA